MSLFESLNIPERLREKKRRKEYLESLSPDDRRDLFDAVVASRRAEIAAEKEGIGAGLGASVDFVRTGVASSAAAVALTPVSGAESAIVAAAGITATSLGSSVYLTAKDKWLDYQSAKLDQVENKVPGYQQYTVPPRELFAENGDLSDIRSLKPLRLDSMRVNDLQQLLENARAKKLADQDVANPVSPQVTAAREKQVITRQAVQQSLSAPEPFDGMITAGSSPEQKKETPERTVAQPSRPAQSLSGQPGVAAEEQQAEKDVAQKQTPEKKSGLDFMGRVREALAEGQKLIDNNGRPVIETPRALIAPANPLLKDDQRVSRIEAMVDHAAEKFKGKPLRLDGNEKFVTTAMDAALARGLTVEVPEKYQQILDAKLAERQKAKEAPAVGKEFEGMIAAGESQQQQRITGRVVGFDVVPGEDGLRAVSIERMGQRHDVRVDFHAMSKKDLDVAMAAGRLVRFEPARDGQPPRLVDLKKEKDLGKQAGLELQR